MLNKFLISLGIWVLRLISLLPMPLTRALGTVMGLIAYALMSKRRHIGMVNLNLCFPEKKSSRETKNLTPTLCRVIYYWLGLWFIIWREQISHAAFN